MKTGIIVAFGVMMFLYSCSSNEETVANQEQTEVEQVTADKLATYDVSGMMCKMGCGGSIRKGMLQTGAVALVEIDFEDERPSNVVKVHFDSKKSSEDELLALITELNDNQFTASLVSVTEK